MKEHTYYNNWPTDCDHIVNAEPPPARETKQKHTVLIVKLLVLIIGTNKNICYNTTTSPLVCRCQHKTQNMEHYM
jgi:hypothetical protein